MFNRIIRWFSKMYYSDKSKIYTMQALFIYYFLRLTISSAMWFFFRFQCNAAVSLNAYPMMFICCGRMVELDVLAASSSVSARPPPGFGSFSSVFCNDRFCSWLHFLPWDLQLCTFFFVDAMARVLLPYRAFLQYRFPVVLFTFDYILSGYN